MSSDVRASGDLAVVTSSSTGARPVDEVATGSARAADAPVRGAPAGALVGNAHVTAVLVARDGAVFLPRALAALAGQTRPPDAVIAVDAGSTDRSRELLDDALPRVLHLPRRRCSFSVAVTAAVTAEVDAASPTTTATAPTDTAAPATAEADTAAPGMPVGPPGDGWLWLLHDDCAPRPEALERLLAAVETAPSVAIAGCKQVDWDDDQRIRDVGLTTTRGGARVSVADRDEVDQGQHDGRSDVLAVSTAGMLIRRELWARLGGADPTLAHARDDLDLGRRAHLAGHRVVVVPGAVVEHAAAWACGRRRGAPSWWRADRRDASQLRLASVPLIAVPLLLVGMAIAAVPRALFRLAMRHPAQARDEVLAVLSVWARPDRWIRSRWRAHRVRRIPRRALRPLYASRRQLWRARRDDVAAWIVPADGAQTVRRGPDSYSAPVDTGSLALLLAGEDPSRSRRSPDRRGGPSAAVAPLDPAPPSGDAPLSGDPAESPGAPTSTAPTESAASAVTSAGTSPTSAAALSAAMLAAIETGPTAEEAESLPVRAPSRRARRRRFTASGVVPVLLLSLAAAVLGAGQLVGSAVFGALANGTAALVGSELLPTPSGAGTLWGLSTAGWRPSGLGAAAVGDPWGAVLAVLGLPFGAAPGRAVALILLGALPLSAMTAWCAAGSLTRSRLVRAWAALVWAAAPPLLAAVAMGRTGATAAHVLLPLAGWALCRAAGVVPSPRRGRGAGHPSVHAGCAAGLLLTVVLAAAPSLTVCAGVSVLSIMMIGAARAPRGGGRRRLRAPASTLPALVVPGVLLAPWWWAVASTPRLLLAGPDLPRGGAVALGSPWWRLLLLPADPGAGAAGGSAAGAAAALSRALPSLGLPASFPHGPGLVAAVGAGLLVVPVILLGLAGLVRRRSTGTALAAWILALTGLATALMAPRVVVGATGLGLDGGAGLRRFVGQPGPGLSMFALGALVAAVAVVERGRRTLSSRRPVAARSVAAAPGPASARGSHASLGLVRGSATTIVGLIVLAGPLAVLAGWSWQGRAGVGDGVTAADLPSLRAVSPDVLPVVAADDATGDAGTRTLVVSDSDGEVRWALARSAGPRLGEDSAALAAAGLRTVSSSGATATESVLITPVLAALLGDGGQDVRGRLADLDIGSVLMVTPAPDDALLGLDSSPGLSRVTEGGGSILWRVDLSATPSRTARVLLVDAAGNLLATLASRGTAVETTLAAGASGRLLRLAERADAGWHATLDGVGLPTAADPSGGWAQTFRLPAHGGRLHVWHDGAAPPGAGTVQALVLVAALLGLLPLPRLRRRLAPPPPPVPSRPVLRTTLADPPSLPPMPRVFDDDHPEDGDVPPLFSDLDRSADPAEPDAPPHAESASRTDTEREPSGEPEPRAPAEPEAAQPEAGAADTEPAEPEAEAAQPEPAPAQPEPGDTEAAEPEAAQPEPGDTEAAEPEAAQPEGASS